MRTALALAKLAGFGLYMVGTGSLTFLFFIVFWRV